MNLLAIVITNSIGIFLALSVLRISYMDRKGNDPDSRLLTALLVICCSCCLMEMISFLVDGKASGFCRAMVWITRRCSRFSVSGRTATHKRFLEPEVAANG